MKDFADIPRISGTFPDVVTVPDSEPQSKDGTPLHKNIVDELFGIMQAALNGAGHTPSGTVDAAATSNSIEDCQFLIAIQQMFQPPGTIVAFPRDAMPSGARYLRLEGQVILRATYPRLVSNVERSYIENGSYFRCDAGGAQDPAGDYMKLPDYRGLFLRGRDTDGTVDPDGDSRPIGNTQDHAVERHNHIVADADGGDNFLYGAALYGSGATGAINQTTSESQNVYVASETNIGEDIDAAFTQVTGVGKVAEESRPINSAVTWAIVY